MYYPFNAIKNGMINYFLKLGCNLEEATNTTNALLLAEASGTTTHGLCMLKAHAQKIMDKKYDINKSITIELSTPSITKINANNTIGMDSAYKCMDIAIKEAKKNGLHVVIAHNCNTLSAAFVYALHAAQHRMIGFVMSNSPAQMAPINGKSKLLGTNPLSYAFPTLNAIPIIFDMATSQIAKSRINQAKKNKEQIPLGWALDEDGNPTTDPEKAVKGLMLPMAGAKGYGLSLMIDLFCGLLSGAKYLNKVGKFYNSNTPMDVGHFFMAIDPQIIYGDGFYKSIDEYINMIHSSQRISDKPIRVPGERKIKNILNTQQNGLELDCEIIKLLELPY